MNSVIQTLNEAFELDPEAISKLVEMRVPCNDQLADHPTIQVVLPPGTNCYHVGLLGILNGIIEPLTGERVCSITEHDGTFKGFAVFKS